MFLEAARCGHRHLDTEWRGCRKVCRKGGSLSLLASIDSGVCATGTFGSARGKRKTCLQMHFDGCTRQKSSQIIQPEVTRNLSVSYRWEISKTNRLSSSKSHHNNRGFRAASTGERFHAANRRCNNGQFITNCLMASIRKAVPNVRDKIIMKKSVQASRSAVVYGNWAIKYVSPCGKRRTGFKETEHEQLLLRGFRGENRLSILDGCYAHLRCTFYHGRQAWTYWVSLKADNAGDVVTCSDAILRSKRAAAAR